MGLCEEAFSNSDHKIEKLLTADLKKIEECAKNHKKDTDKRNECLKRIKIFAECKMSQISAPGHEGVGDEDPEALKRQEAEAIQECLKRDVLKAEYARIIHAYDSCPKLTESASVAYGSKEICNQELQKKYERTPQKGADVEFEEPICTYRLFELASCSLAASREYAASEGAAPDFDPCLINNGVAVKQIPAQAQELIRNTCRNQFASYQGACAARGKKGLGEVGQPKKDKLGLSSK